MNYYTEFIRLISIIQLFCAILCFLYYIKKEREGSYIQILYINATQVIPILLFNFIFIINYAIQKILNAIFAINLDSKYKALTNIDEDLKGIDSISPSE